MWIFTGTLFLEKNESVNVCPRFFIVIHAKMHFVFGLLLCNISFEKNQLLNVSGLEFSYNNWQKKKGIVKCLLALYLYLY